jgi:DNA-directed RNA polymerase subunit N (RpoN/RPB10)
MDTETDSDAVEFVECVSLGPGHWSSAVKSNALPEPIRLLKSTDTEQPCRKPFRVPLPLSAEYARDWNTDSWDPMDASGKPVRCFACSKTLGHRFTPYWVEVFEKGHDVNDVCKALGIDPHAYCCKSMLMSYVSIPV